MFKLVGKRLWAFDAEWVPDPISGRLAYECGPELSDADVLAEMWRRGGATIDEPRPYLKTALCRIVSVAVVIREEQASGSVDLKLFSLPRPVDRDLDEGRLLARFLGKIGEAKPQLVGFNSCSADIPALLQRALANGLSLKQFCERPEKPWQGVDYFARGSDHCIDLKDVFGGWGKSTPSLHELATACGIPGKLSIDGTNVVDLWQEGRIREIVAYNECDALTTYLVWLRAAHLGGFLSTEQYGREQEQLASLLRSRIADGDHEHLRVYLEQWERLRELRRGGAVSIPPTAPALDGVTSDAV